MVLVSGFGKQAEVTGTSFFVMRLFFHNAPTSFVMHLFFHNVPAHYNILVAHYKKIAP